MFIHSFAASQQTLSRFVRRNCISTLFPWLTSGTVLSILCGDSDNLRTMLTMLPRTRPSRSTSRQSSQPNIDPTLFGALSIADLRSLCLQHGIASTGVRKTLEHQLRDLNTLSRGVENIHEPGAQPGLQTNNETAAQRQDFTDNQMRMIQQLIKGTVQQSSREIANEAAKAAITAFQALSSAGFLAPQPASLVPGTDSATSTAAVSFASPFQDTPVQYTGKKYCYNLVTCGIMYQ